MHDVINEWAFKYLNMINNEVDGDFVFSAPGHDDVRVGHGGGDEHVEGRLHMPVILLKNTLYSKKRNLIN